MKIVRTIIPKDVNAVLAMAYKAVYERGYVGVDFDKQHFNFQVKNVMINAKCKCFGLFEDQTLIGFVVMDLISLPWIVQKKCFIYLLHLDIQHRTENNYQMLINAVTEFCEEKNVNHIITCGNCYLLDPVSKENFLLKNNFLQNDIVWERNNDY